MKKIYLHKIYFHVLILLCFFASPHLPFIHRHVQAAVVINEIYPKPSDEQSEWIELFNTSSESVSLNLWKLENSEGEKKSFVINASSIIQPKGFLVFFKSQTGISLRNEGDTIRLIDPSNNEVDSQSFLGILGYNTAIGRSADGTGVWVICTSGTPNTNNSCPEPSPTPSPIVSNTPTPSTSVTPIPTIEPILITPEDSPTPIIEIVYVTKIPTPTPTPLGTITVSVSKIFTIQILVVSTSWALIAMIALHNKSKRIHRKKFSRDSQKEE